MRRQRRGVVQRVERLTPHVVRVVLGGDDLADFTAPQADSYVKLIFPVPGVTYAQPLDVAAERATRPREEWPAQRTYTVRAVDPAASEVTIDFVHHGDEGLAGPWAASAQPGDEIWLLGPGGEYSPSPDAPWHLLVGDASALPAIAASLAAMPAGATAVAVVEVAGPQEQQPLTSPADLRLHWVHSPTADDGALAAALAALDLPAGVPQAFLHGEADSVRLVRRFVRNELHVPRELTSASGYWRRGRTEEGWRTEKADWKAAVERDDATAPA
ncbi:siderophore-interacting protein [Kineococcus rubinsiae]|uniref:siderophore-interacting protein n=1 Tax=Kineococcus rubinsiae TaxID=2609562 RepID=UPI00142FD033|nr:siderophore-interacting protein [Kineococcus rubinsiae]